MHKFQYVVSLQLAIMIGGIFSATPVKAIDLVDEQTAAVATNLELFGGLPQDIVVDPSAGQYVYVATYTPNGLFSSNDAGATWVGLSDDLDYGAGKAITIDPATGTVYAAVGDELLKSSNHGTTWNRLTDQLDGELFIVGSEVAWIADTLLLAVDNGAVQVSSDGGNTFTSVTLQAGARQNVISLSGDETGNIYAVLIDYDTDVTQLFRSVDHGMTWSVMDLTAGGVAANSIFYSVAVDPLDANHLVLGSYHPDYNSYHSFDGGTSWSALVNGSSRVGGQQTVFDGVGGLYVGMNYTSDASVLSPVWSMVNSDTPLSSVRGDLYAVDPTNPNTIYSNTAMGAAKSEDQGATWVDSVDGITAVKTYAVAQATDKDIVWLGANGGLAKTTNFTADHPDWDYPILPEDSAGSIYAVWVKPGNGDYVVTGSSNFFYYTEDGGSTWIQAEAPDFLGTVEAIVPSLEDQQTLYALYTNTSLTEDAYNGGVMMSDDFGKTWSELNFPSTLANGDLAVALENDHDVLFVGIGSGSNDDGIYRYKNDNWARLDADFNEFYVNNLLVHPENNQIIFASFEAESTEGSLYRSQDGGDTWEEITDGLAGTNHLGAMTAQTGTTTTLYLAGQNAYGNEGMLYKSTNGGDSWSSYYVGKKQEFFYALLFDGLVAGNDRGVFDIKSYGKLGIQAQPLTGRRYRITGTLKDAATSTALSNRRVLVYRKLTGKSWRVVDHVRTSAKGKMRFTVTAKRNTKLKLVWKPKPADRAEYARTSSRVLTAR